MFFGVVVPILLLIALAFCAHQFGVQRERGRWFLAVRNTIDGRLMRLSTKAISQCCAEEGETEIQQLLILHPDVHRKIQQLLVKL
jgi:hypothetical protein